MIDLNPIITLLTPLLPQWEIGSASGLETFVSHFHQAWMQIGQQALQQLIQRQIEQVEQTHQGCRQKRSRHYHTPVGTIEVTRRIYDTEEGSVCWADPKLGLPHW